MNQRVTESREASIIGPASVTDGDTIRVNGLPIRLQGVDAPERRDIGGAESTAFMRQLVEGREVACVPDGTRSRERIVAICYRDGQVIGMDHLVGSIAPGKRADFVILDADPFKAGATGLRDIKVDGIVFEGRKA